MSENQQLLTFPFKPHLAQYLFYTIKNEVYSDEEYRHRVIKINMSSIHGQIIRTILEKADYPDIKKAHKGFALTVSIPKRDHRKRLFTDGRSQELKIDPQAVELINHLYQIEFENSCISYIAGRVAGQKRGGLKDAIEQVIKIYHLQDTEYNYDRIRKMYQRHKFPLKEAVYEKKNDSLYLKDKKQGGKLLIDRKLK